MLVDVPILHRYLNFSFCFSQWCFTYPFTHSHTVKAPAFDNFIVHALVTELFVKSYRFHAAIDSDIGIAKLRDPHLGFFDNRTAEVLSAVFGKNDYPSDKDGALIQFIKAARCDRIGIIQKDDVFAFISVVPVKFFSCRSDCSHQSKFLTCLLLPKVQI